MEAGQRGEGARRAPVDAQVRDRGEGGGQALGVHGEGASGELGESGGRGLPRAQRQALHVQGPAPPQPGAADGGGLR